jgi:3-hydroxyisobutyrate dehydrogenase-like beta-hydroxyacid dehydrogenase
MRVGFAGVGRMGRPVCANLVWAGYVVTAGDVRGELDSVVAGVGVRWGGTRDEVAAEAES